jgi:hypothetical protein
VLFDEFYMMERKKIRAAGALVEFRGSEDMNVFYWVLGNAFKRPPMIPDDHGGIFCVLQTARRLSVVIRVQNGT